MVSCKTLETPPAKILLDNSNCLVCLQYSGSVCVCSIACNINLNEHPQTSTDIGSVRIPQFYRHQNIRVNRVHVYIMSHHFGSNSLPLFSLPEERLS